jgi:uncharacterized protein (DUF1778 family)
MSGKTSYASIKKYSDKSYDKILLTVRKGGREQIREAAAAAGQSVQDYIRDAITARMAEEHSCGTLDNGIW